jgi:hypothetical protein
MDHNQMKILEKLQKKIANRGRNNHSLWVRGQLEKTAKLNRNLVLFA